MRVIAAGVTDVGQVREANEDSLAVLLADDLAPGLDAVLVVADGMGGHQAGEVASGLAIEQLTACFGRDGAAAGLATLDGLRGRLADHHRLHAVRAHLLEEAGDAAGAAAEYAAAAASTLITGQNRRRQIGPRGIGLQHDRWRVPRPQPPQRGQQLSSPVVLTCPHRRQHPDPRHLLRLDRRCLPQPPGPRKRCATARASCSSPISAGRPSQRPAAPDSPGPGNRLRPIQPITMPRGE